MRILITGAGGFIGSHLMDALEEEHQVWGFDNFLTGVPANNESVIRLDILNRKDLYLMANAAAPEVVIHCAASYSDPDLWHRDTDVNVAGAINVAAIAKHHGARIIYFQTVLPPISSYAISKIAAEHYLRLSGVPLTVFRLAAVYGPRNLSGAVPTFYRQVSRGLPCTVVEDATRDFVFIEDLVDRVIGEIEEGSSDTTDFMDGTYDIRTGIETPIRHLPVLIGEVLAVSPIINLVSRREDDVAAYLMHGTPYRGVPFSEGLRKAVEWYEEHGVDNTHTHLRIGEKNAS